MYVLRTPSFVSAPYDLQVLGVVSRRVTALHIQSLAGKLYGLGQWARNSEYDLYGRPCVDGEGRRRHCGTTIA